MKMNTVKEMLVEGCKAYCFQMGLFNLFQQ